MAYNLLRCNFDTNCRKFKVKMLSFVGFFVTVKIFIQLKNNTKQYLSNDSKSVNKLQYSNTIQMGKFSVTLSLVLACTLHQYGESAVSSQKFQYK